jgi:hypothetical protein
MARPHYLTINLAVMTTMASATLFAVFLWVLAVFQASGIVAAGVLGTMLLAIVFGFTTASIHSATVLCTMLLGASMRMIGMFAALIARATGMVGAMSAMIGCIRAVFGANRIVAIWMVCTVGFTVVLSDRFMLAMSDASLAFFAFGFFAMLNAIMLDRVYRGLMIGAMLWLHFRRSDCRRCNWCRNGRGYCDGRSRSRCLAFFGSGAAG